MPTSAAMASRVVPSNPRRANSRNPARSISAWLVTGGRPSRDAPCAGGVAIRRQASNRLFFLSLSAINLPGIPPPEEATMPRPNWLSNPWAQNPWFETVAVAQRRAKKRLPSSVYGALVAGSERGQTADDNTAAFRELGFAPHVVGTQPERAMDTTIMGQPISLPVVISPTGVQAVHPDGEVAVARAAAARGTVMGVSNFASKSVEEVVEANPQTLFQMYWTGDRDVMVQRMHRAKTAGAVGLIATLDWSFSMGRDWGSPEIPEKVDLKTMVRLAPQVLVRPRWAAQFARRGFPDLTAPNLAPPGGEAPTFFGAYYEWMTTPPPSWEDVAWMREQWAQLGGGPFMLKGVCRVDDARRAVDAGVTAISVSNHGGNNLDGTPATI